MKKIIIVGAVVSVLAIGGIVNAVTGSKPVKENQASLQRSESVESPVLHSDTVETQSTTSEVKANDVSPIQNQPAQPQPESSPAVQEEPFDAQLYGMSLLQQKAQEGMNMNAECYNNLMVESTGWNMTKAQVDSAFAKVLGYSSTCAAYAQFKATGTY